MIVWNVYRIPTNYMLHYVFYPCILACSDDFFFEAFQPKYSLKDSGMKTLCIFDTLEVLKWSEKAWISMSQNISVIDCRKMEVKCDIFGRSGNDRFLTLEESRSILYKMDRKSQTQTGVTLNPHVITLTSDNAGFCLTY